jgi:hypothetical protein
MAPHTGFDTDSIKDKAQKDILNLLEGVSKAFPHIFASQESADSYIGSRKEESSN